MSSFNNISLYIKRADLHLTKEHIVSIFETNNIGIVKDLQFIKKADNAGREYNGVVITFQRWFMNSKVTQLLGDINSSVNGTAKFIYNSYGHYWFINVHKPVTVDTVTIESVTVDTIYKEFVSLPDKERIIELENLVKSMSSQMHYYQIRQEKTERRLMELEEKDTYHALRNEELRFRLEDKDMEIGWLKEDAEKMLKEKQCEFDKSSYCPNVGEMTIDELVVYL